MPCGHFNGSAPSQRSTVDDEILGTKRRRSTPYQEKKYYEKRREEEEKAREDREQSERGHLILSFLFRDSRLVVNV